jgi:hypothetical protein
LAGGGHYHILMKKKYDCGRKISNIKKWENIFYVQLWRIMFTLNVQFLY